MASEARKRLLVDYLQWQKDQPEGIEAQPDDDDDMLKWSAIIFGPEDTPWEGGSFPLSLEFSEEYPNHPPKVKFTTKIFHPNVYSDGSICLDILQKKWSSIYNVTAILTSIQSLLTDPNPASPANATAAHLFATNPEEYNRKVRESVEESNMETDD